MYQNRLNDAETEIRDKKTRAVKEAEEEANAVLADAKKKKEQMLLDAREAAQHEKITKKKNKSRHGTQEKQLKA